MARAGKASSGRAWFQNEIGRRNLKGCDRCSRFRCVHPDAGRSLTGLPDAPEIFAHTLVHQLLVHAVAPLDERARQTAQHHLIRHT